MSGQPTINRAARDQAVAWIVRLNSGQCSEPDRLSFQVWLDADESHRKEYQATREYWDSLGDFSPDTLPELEEARGYRPGRSRRPALAIAASLLTIFAAAVAFWVRSPTEVPMITYATAKGEQKSVELADGTTVDLNTDTRLHMSFTPGSRMVELQKGEAFFTIAEDKERPFEVVAGKGIIRDVGTAFSVYREGDQVSLVVVEGLILVNTDAFPSPVPLAEGYNLSYDDAGRLLKSEAIDAQTHTAWRNGRMIFKGSSINELAGQIMRYHDVKIVVDHPGLDDLHVSGNFKINDLEGLLAALKMMLPIETTRLDAHTIRLSAKTAS